MGFFGTQSQSSPWFSSLTNQTYVASNSGTQLLVASSTPNTNGLWTQIISSTSDEATLLAVYISAIGINSQDSSTLLSIGVGASGSEASIISGIAVGGANVIDGPRPGVYFFIPVKIPSGSRISGRIQGIRASQNANITIYAYNFGFSSFLTTSSDVIGTDASTSKGTLLSANNSWTEIISSTTKSYSAIALIPSLSSGNISSTTNFTMEIATGGSGSEVIIGKIDLSIVSNDFIAMRFNQFNLIGKEIPAGSRISVRQSSSSTEIYACIIGSPKV